MNLLRIQDALKNASDQQLVQMMQAPDSTAPSYLVLSEIRRRRDMRAKQAPEGDSSRTVAEELMADQQPLGIETLRHGPPERDVGDLPEDREEDDEAGIEAMREGGIVRMQEGGTIQPEPGYDPATYVDYGDAFGNAPLPGSIRGRQRPAAAAGGTQGQTNAQGAEAPAPAAVGGSNRELPTLASLYRENQGLFSDGIGALRERMQQERVDPAARRNEAVNMALIEAGLRIAGSRNPSLIGAIGEGALPAVQSYGQQLGQIRQEQRQARQDEIELAKQELNRQFAVGQISASELRARLSEVSADRRLAAQLAQQASIAARQERTAEAAARRQDAINARILDVERTRDERARYLAQRQHEERELREISQGVQRMMSDMGTVAGIRTRLRAERLRANPSERNPQISDEDVQNFLLDQALRTRRVALERGLPGAALCGAPGAGGAGATGNDPLGIR